MGKGKEWGGGNGDKGHRDRRGNGNKKSMGHGKGDREIWDKHMGWMGNPKKVSSNP